MLRFLTCLVTFCGSSQFSTVVPSIIWHSFVAQFFRVLLPSRTPTSKMRLFMFASSTEGYLMLVLICMHPSSQTRRHAIFTWTGVTITSISIGQSAMCADEFFANFCGSLSTECDVMTVLLALIHNMGHGIYVLVHARRVRRGVVLTKNNNPLSNLSCALLLRMRLCRGG